MKKSILIPALTFFSLLSAELSAELHISLLTYSPGSALYSLFGHSAVRVSDDITQEDLVFNYGTFDFNAPGFYIKFFRGDLLYSLSVTPFETVKQRTLLENRSLTETPLQLGSYKKEKIRDYLWNNALPENRDYQYDFLYDNCSTRIIELLRNISGDSLVSDPRVIPSSSFRLLLDPYFRKKPWAHMGADLLMGLRADKKTKGFEAAFLPDFLYLFIKNMAGPADKKIAGDDLVFFGEYPESRQWKLKPAYILWPLVILMFFSLFNTSILKPLIDKAGKSILFLASTVSFIFIGLWAFSDHEVFSFNIDLLWVNPLLIYFSVSDPEKCTGKFHVLHKTLFFIIITMVISGVIISTIVEKNYDLTATAMIIFLFLTRKLIRMYRLS